MGVASLSLCILLSAGNAPPPETEPAPPPPAPEAAAAAGAESAVDSQSPEVPGVVRYVDAKGHVHYTNDPAQVPAGARVRSVRSDAISEISHHPPRAPTRTTTTRPPLPPESAASAPDDLPSAQEQYWRARFRQANDAVTSLEASLAADRDLAHQLEPVSLYNGRCAVGAGPLYGTPGMGPGFCGGGWAQLQEVRVRVRQQEAALARAREDLQELERQASFRAIPREWRR